jgi:hypothetical protein
MRRSICFSVAAVLVVAFMVTTLPARADDPASVARGRAVGRGLLLLRDPRACGIAVLHERCRADSESILAGRGDEAFASIPHIGARPASGLRAFVNDGDRSGLDPALMYINSHTATAAMWSADSRDAALYDAGINGVLVSAAHGNLAAQTLSLGPVLDLAEHLDVIPSGSLGIVLDVLRPAAGSGTAKQLSPSALSVARDLVVATDRTTPAPPLAVFTYDDGAFGDAVLGVAAATTAELIDSPAWLVQSDAQLFLDAYVARLTVMVPERRPQLAAFRATLRRGDVTEHDATLNAHTAMISPLLGPNKPHTKGILLGMLSAQLVYNAAVLHDPGMSRAALGIAASEGALDAAIPGWSASRAVATGIGATDWTSQYRFGLRMVDLIMKGGSH